MEKREKFSLRQTELTNTNVELVLRKDWQSQEIGEKSVHCQYEKREVAKELAETRTHQGAHESWIRDKKELITVRQGMQTHLIHRHQHLFSKNSSWATISHEDEKDNIETRITHAAKDSKISQLRVIVRGRQFGPNHQQISSAKVKISFKCATRGHFQKHADPHMFISCKKVRENRPDFWEKNKKLEENDRVKFEDFTFLSW